MNVPGGQTKRVVMQNAVTAAGDGTVLPCVGVSGGAFTTATIQVQGITTATITWKATIDGSNYVAIQATNLNDGTEATTATADGIYRITCIGLTNIMADITAYTSGTITVMGVACA